MARRLRVCLGVAIWAAAFAGVGWLAHVRGEDLRRPAQALGRYAVVRPVYVTAELPGPLARGDPLLDPSRRQLGRVVAVADLATGAISTATWCLPRAPLYRIEVALDPERALPPGARLLSRYTPNTGEWVLATLLPEAKRELVARELQAFAAQHHVELEAFLRPLAEDAITHGMAVLEANLQPALDRRRDEIQALLDAHRVMVRDDLLPVLKERLGPLAKAKAQPILTLIGRQLWDELPVWSLGWSAFVDTIPGTDRNRVDRWWAEFVEEKAIPIVSAHEEDLLRALEELIREGAEDPEVRAALAQATRRLAADPRFKALVRGVLEDALVRPFDAAALAERLLGDPAHRARLRRLEALFAPTLQRIGRVVTVDPETGRLDPGLARVLRRVVFEKDVRWIEAVEAEAGPERGS